MSWSLDDWSLVDWALDEPECAGLLPAVVGIDLGIPNAGEFILDTSELDGPDVLGTGFTTVTNLVNRVSIRRGRTGRLIDPIDAGSCSIVLNNENRDFDPAHAAGPYFGAIVPARDVAVSVGGVRIFTGFVEDWDLDYDVSGRSTAAARCTDALGILGQCSFTAWTNTATTGGGKLSNICNRPEIDWPAWLRWFDDNLFGFDSAVPAVEGLLQPDNVSWGSNALNYCQLIARSDLFSLFFANANGVLRYRQYPHPFIFAFYIIASGTFTPWRPPVVAATFGGSGIPFQSVARRTGSDMLYSSVSVDREGGTAQTRTVADLAAWKATYGRPRRLSIPDTLVARDVYTDSIARDLLALVDDAVDMISDVVVELAPLSCADQVTVLSIDIGDAVTVTFHPNGVGSPITQTWLVQGITHDISPASHTVSLSLFDYFGASTRVA
jgi:hypothetical protein